MDEITIDGKTYISSKRAAGITGYAKDYVGQLCREGRVEARLIGRSWYVFEESIRKHRFEESESTGAKEEEKGETSENTNVEAVWTEPVYTSEVVQMLPVNEEKKEPETVEEEGVHVLEEVVETERTEPEPVHITPIHQEPETPVKEEEWNDWFSEPTSKPKQVEAEQEMTPIEKEVPIAVHVMKDIQPPVPLQHVQEPIRTNIAMPAKRKGYLVYKALAVALIVFGAAVALIGSGAVDRFEGSNNIFVNFLGGTSFIK